MEITVHIIHAFVDGDDGGNPAGVVLDADLLTPSQKSRIAAEVGVSETAFVSRSDTADFKLDFFTPTRQIAHCGHATIAVFGFLEQQGRIGKKATSKETIDGNRDIVIEGDMAFMEQSAPRYQALKPMDEKTVIDSLGLNPRDILAGYSPTVVNTGNAFLIVPLSRDAAVQNARPDPERVSAVSEAYDLIGYYLFCRETRIPGRDVGARMFAPRYGIPEESATGMAAGPLACFLYDRLGMHKDVFLVEQGHFMQPPSPSVITVRLSTRDGSIQKVMAGGKAKVMRSFEMVL